MTPDERSRRQSSAQKAVEKRRENLPDDHPLEIQRREKLAEQIRAENEERKRLEGHRHSEVRENRHHQWRGDVPTGVEYE